MAKMTDGELDKALNKITDQIANKMVSVISEADRRMADLELKEYNPAAFDKVENDLSERLKEIKRSFNEQVKKITRQIEK